MTAPISGAGVKPTARPELERLHKAAHQFEGVFMAQLFQEMRASVPADQADPGQEMFTSMMDDTIANIAAARSSRGPGEALYRQLAARLGMAPDPTAGVDHGNGRR